MLRVQVAVRDEVVHSTHTKTLCVHSHTSFFNMKKHWKGMMLKEKQVNSTMTQRSSSFSCCQEFLWLEVQNCLHVSKLTFTRYCQTAFQSFGASSHSHQYYNVVLVPPHLHQHLPIISLFNGILSLEWTVSRQRKQSELVQSHGIILPR